MLSERASILKKKGISANGQFQNMHLAVYPFEIQFLKDVSKKTAFYFQKKYQVIGKIQQTIPPCVKGSKYPLKSFDNIINFRLFSQSNVVYQWSAYTLHEEGEEEYVDSCAINLKEIVTNFIIPQKSLGSHSLQSLITLSSGNQELKLKFPKLGVILSINLLISDDPRSIRQVLEKKYSPDNQQNLPGVNLLKRESISGMIPLSSRKNNSSDEQKKQLLSSINMLKHESKQKTTKPDILDLDNLILSQDRVQQSIDPLDDNEFQQIKLQINGQREEEVRRQKQKKSVKIQQQEKKFPNKQLQIQNDISSGILKLQSDQVQKESVDIKLELEQLEMIEEEIRSSKQTINETISPRFQSKKTTDKNASTPKKKLPFKPIKQQQNEQASTVAQPKFTLKKAIIYFIIFFLISIAAATIIKGIKQKKGKPKRK